MLLIPVSALISGVFTAIFLWPHIGPLAILVAPLVGSLVATGIAAVMAYREWRDGRDEVIQPTEEMQRA